MSNFKLLHRKNITNHIQNMFKIILIESLFVIGIKLTLKNSDFGILK